ncbi:hypothetical protein DL768_009180 [Monosporascus sp. mg162]|nr:hypothetical protein DL768_009180 [Monosporascus sp. mg162]
MTHSFTTCDDGIVHWYDPNTGEVCDPLDCGGGRAPPKTNVPGCPLYTGTAVRTTSYLSCWTPSGSQLSTTAVGSPAGSSTDLVGAETTSALPTTISALLTTMSALPTTTSALLSTQVTVGSSTPATTVPASLLTTVPPAVNDTLTTSSTVAQSTPTGNAGFYLRGSLKVVGGAAIGVIALA